MSPARNLVNLSGVRKEYSTRTVLSDVTLGVNAGERIGVVGRNGEGKSTLLRLIAGAEVPDGGVLTRVGDLGIAMLAQGDELREDLTIREELVGDRAEHEWAGDRGFRDVLNGLLGGVELTRFADGLETTIRSLSGGERRRIALANLLLDAPELLLLDEPTNHLDVEAISWLAGHLAARRGTMLVVTHDRWFLDAVGTATWEVDDGVIHRYEGGYAAYVLARAERDRRVLESLEAVRGRATLSDGQEITAGMLCDRFGFRGDRARTLVRDLSGGERRRLQLMRLLMGEPNVLLLDEPTNDLDIDTLTALEDLLDRWPGTLVVVSHDRYFVERVCDDVFALTEGGGIRHLPGGIEQYLELHQGSDGVTVPSGAARRAAGGAGAGAGGARRAAAGASAARRAAAKEVQRLERAIDRHSEHELALEEQMLASATDHAALSALTSELEGVVAERKRLEAEWLAGAEALEG